MLSNSSSIKSRKEFWRKVPSVNSFPKLLAEAYYAMPTQTLGYGSKFDSGWSYQILPLNTSLSQRGNDPKRKREWDETENKRIYVGTQITGISAEDGKKHKGRVCNFTFQDDKSTVKFFWIIDEKTEEVIPITAKTASVYVQSVDFFNRSYTRMNLEKFYENPKTIFEAVDLSSFDEDDDYLKDRKYPRTLAGYQDTSHEHFKAQDAVYRSQVIKMINRSCKEKLNGFKTDILINVFDHLFYTNFYTANYLEIRAFDRFKFQELLGLTNPSSTEMKRELKKLTKWFCEMTGEEETFKFKVVGNSYMDIEPNWCFNSYKDIYVFCKCVQNICRQNMQSDIYIERSMDRPEDTEVDEIDWETSRTEVWNRNVNSSQYLRQLFSFLASVLVFPSFTTTREYYTREERDKITLTLPLATNPLYDGHQHDGKYRWTAYKPC